MTPQDSSGSVRAYLVPVLLLLFVLPAGCVLAEAIAGRDASELPLIVSKWFVFWGVGVRLFLTGARQIFQPDFTATKIFELASSPAWRPPLLSASWGLRTWQWERWASKPGQWRVAHSCGHRRRPLLRLGWGRTPPPSRAKLDRGDRSRFRSPHFHAAKCLSGDPIHIPIWQYRRMSGRRRGVTRF